MDKHADVQGGHFDNTHFLTGDGGFLQALLNGWGGLRVTGGGLKLRRPALPEGVGTLSLRRIASRGGHLDVAVAADATTVALLDGAPRCLTDAAGARAATLVAGGAAARLDAAAFAYPGLIVDGAC